MQPSQSIPVSNNGVYQSLTATGANTSMYAGLTEVTRERDRHNDRTSASLTTPPPIPPSSQTYMGLVRSTNQESAYMDITPGKT